MKDLDYSGERVVPNKVNKFLWNEHFARYITASHFTNKKIVLDIGCGTGYGSDYISSVGAKHVVGIDRASDAISYAQTKYQRENLQFEIMDALSLKIEDKKFDVVVAFEVIEHLDNQEKFLKEISRVLKKQGILIVSTPNREMNPEGYVNPFHTHEFTRDEFDSLLHKYFKNVKLYLQNHIFGIIISPSDVDEVDIDNSLLHKKRQSQYLVSVCSDGKLPEDIKLFFPTFYDHDDYLNALYSTPDAELNELKKLINNENFIAALEHSSKYLTQYENNIEWLYLRAFCLQMLKKYDESLQYYDIALKKGFDEFWIRYNRGSMLIDMGDISSAKIDLEKAIALNPDHQGAKNKFSEVINIGLTK